MSGREGFREAVFARLAEDPALLGIAPGLLYRTLGTALPEGMRNAATLWAVCHEYAMSSREALLATGLEGEGMELGEALFDALVTQPSGVIFSHEEWADVWARVPDGTVQLGLPDLLADAAQLNNETPQEASAEFPFLLSAGERRSFTANTIIRNPEWRRKDVEGALYINPDDAARLNLGEGSTARVSTQTGALDVLVGLNDRMRKGHVSLPNGMGLDYPDEEGALQQTGVSPNELTSSDLRDEYAGTPWHKSVPARIEAVD
jgi:anaerobic selenocysteine-containing dehydrogenase